LAGPSKTVISNTYRDSLDAIQVLATSPAVFKIVINSLLEKLDYACSSIGKKEKNHYIMVRREREG
jgi:hypothetical protein